MRKVSKRANERRTSVARKVVTSRSQAFYAVPKLSRRIHVVAPLSADEIREVLNISKADLDAARRAIKATE